VEKCIILANGKAPSKKNINYLIDIGYSTIICADGGANTAYRYKLLPDIIIGDLDSIKKEVIKYYEKKCLIKKISQQDDTDVEKCLEYAINKKISEVVLLGATGNRLDHSFCNLGILLKYFSKIKITMIHGKSILRVYHGKISLVTIPGETISFYGIDSRTKFISSGLKYPLTNFSLPFGERESTSNEAIGNKIDLTIKGGKAFIIRDFGKLKKHGLI
jgi:thiamine pyrophosphokinase